MWPNVARILCPQYRQCRLGTALQFGVVIELSDLFVAPNNIGGTILFANNSSTPHPPPHTAESTHPITSFLISGAAAYDGEKTKVSAYFQAAPSPFYGENDYDYYHVRFLLRNRFEYLRLLARNVEAAGAMLKLLVGSVGRLIFRVHFSITKTPDRPVLLARRSHSSIPMSELCFRFIRNYY